MSEQDDTAPAAPAAEGPQDDQSPAPPVPVDEQADLAELEAEQ